MDPEVPLSRTVGPDPCVHLFQTTNHGNPNIWTGPKNSKTLSATHHSLLSEVNTHCACELAVELVVCVPVEEGGLSHPGVPQGQQFDQVVIVPVSHCAAERSTCHSKKKKEVGLMFKKSGEEVSKPERWVMQFPSGCSLQSVDAEDHLA